MQLREILSRCDHTLLRQDATAAEIIDLCDEALRLGAASAWVPPCHVAGAHGYVDGRLRLGTVVGFPFGYATPSVKAFEAQDAIRNGADELGVVVNLAMVRDACWDSLLEEMRSVRAFTEGHTLGFIIEAALVTDEEKRTLCRLVSESGAEYIVTSAGLSGGVARGDVRLLRACCSGHVRIKAAGTIATLEEAEDLLALGADRLGTGRLADLAGPAGPAGPAARKTAAPSAPEERSSSQ